MILTVHLVTGAALASKIQPLSLVLLLSFLSHYFLDSLPHPNEYSINNIKEKKWRKSLPDFLKIGLDISVGLLIISVLTGRQPTIYLAALLASLPDFFTFLSLVFPRWLSWHEKLHKKIHFAKYKKIPFFWRFFIQATILATALLFLVF
ncbi:MAG TPA: hypothetical protein VMW21_01590 [Patescibacteria group bacterium]|nr:hypothetical protein [Patescibacteria group bacterium]